MRKAHKESSGDGAQCIALYNFIEQYYSVRKIQERKLAVVIIHKIQLKK